MTKLVKELSALLHEALVRNVARSLSLSVSFGDHRRSLVIHRGQTQGASTDDHAQYDLASLTKILGTTVAVAHAVARGAIALDCVPFSFWPKKTVRMLLAHRAGLLAHARFYEQCPFRHDFAANRAAVYSMLSTIEAQEKQTARLYSDLGFIALGFWLEQKLKLPLATIFANAWNAFACAQPLQWYQSQKPTYSNRNPHLVPTGICHVRKQLIAGQVHDPNCYFMGGLEGHAGLFGTLSDVDAWGQVFLCATRAPKNPTEALLQEFAQRGVGFDKPTNEGSTRHLSPQAFGHFGYTGTSLWVDPAHNVVITLLTNRVHCSERPEGIFWLRLAVNRLILQWLRS